MVQPRHGEFLTAEKHRHGLGPSLVHSWFMALRLRIYGYFMIFIHLLYIKYPFLYIYILHDHIYGYLLYMNSSIYLWWRCLQFFMGERVLFHS